MRCFEWAKTAELLRRSKLSILPETVPKIVLSHDVMQPKVRNKFTYILVMTDHGKMLIRHKMLPIRTALTAFKASTASGNVSSTQRRTCSSIAVLM